MNPSVPITLADLIRRGSNLDAREAERLALAWFTEIRLELEQTGISVIRGVGTLTLSAGRVRFQQDPDFPIGSELPAVEGFSEAVAASLQAASSAPKPPPKAPAAEIPVSEAAPDTEAPPAWEELAQVETAETEAEQDQPAGPEDGSQAWEPESVEPEDPADDASAAPMASDDHPVVDEEPLQEAVAPTFGTGTPGSESGEPEDPKDGDAWTEGIEAALSQADARVQEPDAPQSEETAPHPASRRSSRSYGAAQEGSSRWILAVAAVVVLVVIGAVLYRFVLAPEAAEPPALAMDDSSSVQAADSTGVEADSTDMATTAEELDSDPLVEDLPETRPPVNAPAPETNTQADPGSVTPGMGGYTLIVGSTLNATAAERVRTRYAGLGLPTGVLPITADSTTRYRIAVGHFPSAAEADTLRIRRASELPQGTWVLSVR